MARLTFEREAELILFQGQSGCGKTYNMRECLLRQIGDPFNPDKSRHAPLYPGRKHVVIDPGVQFALWKGAEHASHSVHRTRCVVYPTVAHLAHMKAMWHKADAHIIQAPGLDIHEIIIFCMEAGGCNLWIDEIDEFIPKHGDLKRTEPIFYELLHRSRHFGTTYYNGKYGVKDAGWGGTGCGVVASCRSFANTHNDILRKMSTLVITRNEEIDDNHRLARQMGQDKHEFHERISNLEIPDIVRFDRRVEIMGEARWDLHQLTDPK